MSNKDLDRLHVLKKTLAKELTQEKAGELLKIGSRQVRRLLRRLKNEGPKGIVSRLVGKSSNRSKPASFKQEVIQLLRTKYEGFGPKLASEKLLEYEGLKIHGETIRQWMIEHRLWIVKRKKRKIHLPRARRPCFGELIQGDGSSHKWFGEDGPRANATVLLDDATSSITSIVFSETESLEAYYTALEQHINKYGIPRSLYTDHYAVFETHNKRGETQMQRSLKELDIELILANSAQAKGKVERTNRVLQDRLVKEFKLKGIKTIEEANAYMPEYIEKHNKLFSKRPTSSYDAHRSLEGFDLQRILCRKEIRSLNSSAVFQFNNIFYQLQGVSHARRLNRKKIEIRLMRTGEMRVYMDGEELKAIPLNEIIEQPKVLSYKEVLNYEKRSKVVSLHHPWKIGFNREIVRKRMLMI